MLKFSSLALAITSSLVMASTETVYAFNIQNSSFETGSFSNWETIGQTTLEGSDFGVSPTNGNHQAVLETLQETTGISGANLETFLGLSAGNLTSFGSTEGSAIKQSITVNAGDSLSFDWNFLSDDFQSEDYNDFAFLSITNVEKVANTFSPTLFSFSRLSNETGYQSYTYNFQVTGTYTLGLGVVDVGDGTVNSAFLVDNFKLYTAPQSVPEPTSTLGMSIVGFSFLIRKKMNKSGSSVHIMPNY